MESKIIRNVDLREDDPQTLHTQLENIIKEFDQAKVCPGISGENFERVKLCAGGVFTDGLWRSTACESIYSSDKPLCSTCHPLRRALVRLAGRPLPKTLEEKIVAVRAELASAKQTIGRKTKQIEVEGF